MFNKYPIDVKFSSYHLDNFYEWQTFFTNQTVSTNRNDEKFVAFTICAIINQNIFEDANLARIKRNVAKMISMNAPKEDIDGYIVSEGVTIEDLNNFASDNNVNEKHINKFREMFPQYDDLSDESLVEKLDAKYNDRCSELKQYMTQEISIFKANYLYLLKLLWALFWFYLPFLLSCIVKWIYTGFKEK